MAIEQLHLVQPYVRTKKGHISRAPLRPCSTADLAKRLAERIVASKTAVGATAFSRMKAGEDFDEPEILLQVGDVPGEATEFPF